MVVAVVVVGMMQVVLTAACGRNGADRFEGCFSIMGGGAVIVLFTVRSVL